MKKRIVVLATLLGGLIALVPRIPLAWVGPHVILATSGQDIHYSGTIWNGQVTGLDFIGAVNFKLAPSKLFAGLPLTFQTQSPIMQISGQASKAELKNFRFYSGQFSSLPTRDGRLRELDGQVNISVSKALYDGTCVSAAGQASTDFLSRNEARWQWRGPELAGPVSCEDGDVIVRLSGSDNNQTVRADLRIAVDGGYRADISVQTNQPEAGIVLPLYGFELLGREYKLTEQGQWR